MKKRYISLILVLLCLLVVSSAGFGFAKYKTEKSQEAFTLSSNVAFNTYTYAVLDDDGQLAIRSRSALIGNGKLFEANGTVYDLANVFALPCDNYRNLAPEGAQKTWINSGKASEIKSILVETEIQPNTVADWFTNLTSCTSMDLDKLTLPGTTTLTADLFTGSDALAELSVPGNVTAIEDNCFYKNDKTSVLKSVTLPDGVTFIGNNAFRYCTKLESINLTDNLTSIGTYCFDGCTSLSQIHISKNLTAISEGAFRHCSNMTITSPYVLPPNLTTLGGQAFYGCSRITVAVDENFFPDNLTMIGNQAFQECTAITGKLVLPDRAITYGTHTFQGTGITELVIPASCTLSDYMFKNCRSLTEVTISEGITVLPVQLFYGCTAIPSIQLPVSLRTIKGAVFHYTHFTSIVIPDGVTTIDEGAFSAQSYAKVIFYNGDATGAPWGMNKGLVVNYQALGDVAPVFTSTGNNTDSVNGMSFSLPEGVVMNKVRLSNETQGTVMDVDVTNGQFTIPKSFISAGNKITLSEPPVEYAVYSEHTNTLYFLNDILIAAGDTIPGTDDTATAVYDNIKGSNGLGSDNDWAAYAGNIVTVKFLGDIAPISMSCWFENCTSLTAIDGMAEHLDTSNVRFMDSVFAGCTQLTVLDLSGFNTASVMDMTGMFNGCSSLKTIYASESFVTSKLSENDQVLFNGCTSLVGGYRTAFDGTKTDCTYAWINGRDGKPGYFTALVQPIMDSDSLPGVSWSFGVKYDGTWDFNVGKDSTLILNSADGNYDFDVVLTSSNGETAEDNVSIHYGNTHIVDIPAEMMESGTFFIISKKEVAPNYIVYENPLAGGEETLVEDTSTISFGDSGLAAYSSEYYEKVVETIGTLEDYETFYSGIKNSNGEGISLQALLYDFYRVAYSGVSANEVTVTAHSSSIYDGSVYAVLSFAKFSEDNTTFTLEHIAFEAIVGESDVYYSSVTFTLPAAYLTRLQTEVAFFSIASAGSGEEAAEVQRLEEDGLVHLTATCDPAEIIPGEAFTITLTPDAGYALPETVTVTINGEDKTAEVTYENGVIIIPDELVTEGIAISVTAEAKQQITVSIGEGLTATPTVPIPGEAFTITLTGEALPDGVTVTIDGAEATTAVYDKAAGTVTIPSDLLTGATTSITITEAAAPEAPTATCNCTAQCAEGAANSDCPVCGTIPENCSPVVCTCETICAGDAVNDECPVCSADTASCSPKEPETAAECGCTVTCTENTVNADCKVCTADWSRCNIQADSAPTEASPTITVNTNGISNLSFSPDATPAINQDYTAGMAPHEGYTLPETITVDIDGQVYTVFLNGQNPEGCPDFHPGSAILTIPAALLTEQTRLITIIAPGVKLECSCQIKCTDLNQECSLCAASADGCLGQPPEETEPTRESTEPTGESTEPTGESTESADPSSITEPTDPAAATEPVPTEPAASAEPTS